MVDMIRDHVLFQSAYRKFCSVCCGKTRCWFKVHICRKLIEVLEQLPSFRCSKLQESLSA